MPLKHIISSLVAAVAGLLVYQSAWHGVLGTVAAYFLLVAVILLYGGVQALYVSRRREGLFFLNPTIHFGFLGPLLTFGLGSLMFVLPDQLVRTRGFERELSEWAIYYVFLLLLGFIGLWTGYWSRAAVRLGRWIQTRRFLKQGIRREYVINYPIAIVIILTGYAAKLLAIALGVYGYSSDPDLLARFISIRQYMSILGQLSTLGLLVLALGFFRRIRGSRRAGLWLALVFVLEVFFGLLSGFKSQVVMPILVVGVAFYAVRGSIPKWVLPGGVILLVLAYSVIEPFRVTRHSDPDWQSASIFYLVESMFFADPVGSRARDRKGFDEMLVHLSSTRHAVPIYSEGIVFANEVSELPAGSPQFLRDIFLAPVIAVVPRFLWPGKPETRHGQWYVREVLGLGTWERTAVGMSPVTYLYFAAGVFGVVLGFLLFGILQRGIFIGFAGFGAGGMLIFLGLLSQLRGLDSLYYGFIVSLIRYLPLLFVVQMLVFRAVRR